MAADMKKLDSLSKQIDQYESHLAMVKNDIARLSADRDKAREELASLEAKSRATVEHAQQKCDEFKGAMKALQDDSNAQKQKLQDERQALNQERSALVTQWDALEMKRRDLENEKRRVGGFVQIIDQAVKAWK